MRHEAIRKAHPNVVTITIDSALDKDDKVVSLDETKILEETKKLQADYDAKKYQRDRLAEYPDLQECIHAILDNDLTALQARRKLVKEKYPKP
tara:strand:- start:14495 stop:14773 length:279 start_codon:yes stop_codon:yes gene_type:complete